MNSQILFYAISQAMILSLGQGFLNLLLLKIITKAAPGIPAFIRYRLFYGSLSLIFISFLMAVFQIYSAANFRTEHLQIFTGPTDVRYSASETTILNWLKINSGWIAGIYLTGVCIQSLILISGLFKIKAIKNQQKSDLNVHWDQRLEKLSSRLKISNNVSLYFSNKILVPLTAGFIKPIILFPLAMINKLNTEQVEAILLHELAHIKRNDYVWNIFQRIMEIVLFFNPSVWLISKEIRIVREFCCDDLAVKYSSNANLYASALVLLEENKYSQLQLAHSASGSGKYPLLNRIKRITIMKPLNNNPKLQLLTLISILGISLSLAWALPTDTVKTKIENKQTDKIPLPPAPPALTALKLEAPAPPVPPVNEIMNAPHHPILTAPPAMPSSVNIYPPEAIDTIPGDKNFDNPEWKKQMEQMKIETEKMKKQFDSPEWKKQMEQMKIETEKMKKQFESPEWKKQMEQMKIDAEKMKKQFDSPEWKKQMEQMKIDAEKMKKQFDSPEWKKQMEQMKIDTEKMKKQFDSPEWKKQMEELKTEAENLKKEFNNSGKKKELE